MRDNDVGQEVNLRHALEQVTSGGAICDVDFLIHPIYFSVWLEFISLKDHLLDRSIEGK